MKSTNEAPKAVNIGVDNNNNTIISIAEQGLKYSSFLLLFLEEVPGTIWFFHSLI